MSAVETTEETTEETTVEAVEKAGEDEVTVEAPRSAQKTGLFSKIGLAAGRVPAAARIVIVVLLVVLVIGSGVGAWLWSGQVSDSNTKQANETAAVAAAKADVPLFLSYNYKTLKSDLAKGAAVTTGQWAGQFSVLSNQMIAPEAAKQQVVTKAVVPVAAAVDSSGNQVTVLLYLDQSTTSKAQPKATVVPSQVKVTMQKVNGKWLVAVFNAL